MFKEIITEENILYFFNKNKDNVICCSPLIFDEFFNFFLKINFDLVDLNQSIFGIDADYTLYFLLISKSHNNCKLSFVFYEDYADIYIGRFEFVLAEYFKIKNKKSIKEFEDILKNLFEKKIKEELFYYNDEIKKYKYTFYLNGIKQNKDKEITYKGRLGLTWFWEKKKIEEKLYLPWLDKNAK
jgi:hypothetical protein